jgi:hypothetical protein
MDANMITSQDGLRIWLDERSRGKQYCIALRAAQRAAIFWWSYQFDRPKETPPSSKLKVFRVLLTIEAILLGEQEDVRLIDALRDALWSLGEFASEQYANQFDDSERVAAILAARSAAFAAATIDMNCAMKVVGIDPAHKWLLKEQPHDSATSFAVAAVTFSQADTKELPDGANLLWKQVIRDCARLEHESLEFYSLWDGDVLDGKLLFSRFAKDLSEKSRGWAFWKYWYHSALNGRPLDWSLSRSVALIPNAEWERGFLHIHAVVAKIVDGEGHSLAGNPEGPEQESISNGRYVQFSNQLIISQIGTLIALTDEQVERARGHNTISDSDAAAVLVRIELLEKIAASARAMRCELESGEVPTVRALTVVHDQLPQIVESADRLQDAGGEAVVSFGIYTMAATIKVLTEAGTPGHIATGVALADLLVQKLKSLWTKS